MCAAWPWPEDTEAVETLNLLLSHGADANAVDEHGKTALIHLLEDDEHDGKRETVAAFPAVMRPMRRLFACWWHIRRNPELWTPMGIRLSVLQSSEGSLMWLDC